MFTRTHTPSMLGKIIIFVLASVIVTLWVIAGLVTIPEFVHADHVESTLCDVIIYVNRSVPCLEVYDCQCIRKTSCDAIFSPCSDYSLSSPDGIYRCCKDGGSDCRHSQFCRLQVGTCQTYDLATRFLADGSWHVLNTTRSCPIAEPVCVGNGRYDCWWDTYDALLRWSPYKVSTDQKLALFFIIFITFLCTLATRYVCHHEWKNTRPRGVIEMSETSESTR